MPLSAVERMTLIKEISSRLSPEDWPLIDVTLQQFGCPIADTWSQSKDAYVLTMVSKATDDGLTGLAEYVGLKSPPGTARIDPPFWRKDMFRLFVSHLSPYRAFAAELQEALLPFGITAFVAHNDIEPTAEWQSQIEIALASCESLVALLHEKFHVSSWTDQEIGFAKGRGLPVFAVRLGQDPYGFIGRFQAFNGNGKTAAQLARELFDAYRKNKETQPRMARVLMSLFEQSTSFAEAKLLVAHLKQLEVWDPSFSARLIAAVRANGQISGAWGVPEDMSALIKKWAGKGIKHGSNADIA